MCSANTIAPTGTTSNPAYVNSGSNLVNTNGKHAIATVTIPTTAVVVVRDLSLKIACAASPAR